MTAWITGADRVSFFFEAPGSPLETHSVGGRVSTLCLLRRELLDTLGHDPDTVSEAEAATRGVQHRPFASSMLMLTVLDLLAKFAYGDASGQVGQRFKRLIEDPNGAGLPPHQAEVFWRVRNSLVHAFGLPHETERAGLGLQNIGAWRRHRAEPDICAEIHDGQALIYVDGVYTRVLRTIAWSYDVAKRDGVSSRFEELLDKYGAVFFARG
jgi:hypothetical protein